MKKFIGLFLFFLFLCFGSYSQSVGLVLSGGGAKGMAHIGVIKALEENNIPIDYVAGTSAGAIVAALYASGYSVEEMTYIFTSGAMDSYLASTPDRNKGYLYKENRQNSKLYTFKINVDSSLIHTKILPTYIIAPHSLDYGFMEFFAQANTVCDGNFDNLMVPFRCVASSINDNDEYVMRKGDLSTAVRASMTFPFFFNPIYMDEKVLMDGGMYNNFPVNVMQEDFNPDIIIGCSVASNYAEPQEDNIISVLQNIFMTDTDFSMPENGVLIKPNVIGIVSLLDFSKTPELIDSGYYACTRQMELIKTKVTRQESQEELRAKRESFNQKKKPLFFKDIYALNVTKSQFQYIDKLMTGNKYFVSSKELHEKYDILVSDDKIISAFPTATYNKATSFYDMKLNIKKDYNLEAEIGGNLAWDNSGQLYVNGRYKYFGRFALDANLGGYLGRFYKSVSINGKIDYPGKQLFYGIIDATINQKKYFATSTNFYSDVSPSYLIQNERHILVQTGMSTAKRSVAYLKFAVFKNTDIFYNTNYFSVNDTADYTIFNGLTAGINYTKNTFNKYIYPDAGYLLKLDVDFVHGKEKYYPGTTSLNSNYLEQKHNWFRVSAIYQHYFLSIKYYSIGLSGNFVFSNQKPWSNYMSSLLHANSFEPFQNCITRFLPEYRAYSYSALGLKSMIKLPYNFLITMEGYAFAPINELYETENQHVATEKMFKNVYYLGSLGLVFNNILIPVSLNFNLYDNKETPFTISCSIGYMFFNRYALE